MDHLHRIHALARHGQGAPDRHAGSRSIAARAALGAAAGDGAAEVRA